MILPAVTPNILGDVLHANNAKAWITAAITAAVAFVVLLVLKRVLVSRLAAIASRTTNQIDDMFVEVLRETHAGMLFVFALLIGAGSLTLPDRAANGLSVVAKLFTLWQLALWSAAGINFWTKWYLTRRTATNDRASIAMINAMGVSAKVVLWVLVFITALHSAFNINPTSLITTLGVSGIAVALAVQNILGDLLAALAIVFDKPFDVGDTIGVDTITGVVEHIGLKTTRIRSQNGEQVIVGNSDLLKSRLRNYRRMQQRRVAFTLDVPFDTPPDVLARLPQALAQIVNTQSPVRFDRSHVASFTDSGVRIETVYYVLDPDYKIYMDIQQAINLAILRQLANDKVTFAMPSHTVYQVAVENSSS